MDNNSNPAPNQQPPQYQQHPQQPPPNFNYQMPPQPPQKKKNGCLIAVLVVVGIILLLFVIGIFAIGSTSSVQTENAPADNNISINEQKPEKEIPNKSNAISVEEQVLLDQNDIKIVLKSLAYDNLFGPELKVLIENNSSEPVIIQVRDSSVNGIMIDNMFSPNIEPGKKSNDGIVFSDVELSVAGVEELRDIEFKFDILDSSYGTIFESDTITITTSSTYTQPIDDSGTVVLDQNNIKVVVKRLESVDSFWGADIYVYVENNSDNDVIIQVEDTSINGFMVDNIFSCNVLAGKKAFDSITFFESELTDSDITEINELECSFVVLSTSYNTIFDSDKITITFQQ